MATHGGGLVLPALHSELATCSNTLLINCSFAANLPATCITRIFQCWCSRVAAVA